VIWKGVGVLGVAAGLVIMFVVGLARLTVPDEPTFGEGFEDAAENPDGSIDFVPTAIGGELQISGAREGTITLDGQVDGPTYGLGSGRARVFFESDPLAINQMSYDGLAFFPEPEECEFTVGQHNEETGLAAVQITCAELVDIRGNGTVSISGFAALPADLVVDLDLPKTGGAVTVGDVTFEPEDPLLFIGPSFEGSGQQEIGLNLFTPDIGPGAEDTAAVYFVYDGTTDTLTLTQVGLRRGLGEVAPGECESQNEELAVINPQASIWEVTFSCQSVDVSSQGSVPVEGTVIYQKVYFADH